MLWQLPLSALCGAAITLFLLGLNIEHAGARRAAEILATVEHHANTQMDQAVKLIRQVEGEVRADLNRRAQIWAEVSDLVHRAIHELGHDTK